MSYKDIIRYITPPLENKPQKIAGLIYIGIVTLKEQGIKIALHRVSHEKKHAFAVDAPVQLGTTEQGHGFTWFTREMSKAEYIKAITGPGTDMNFVDQNILNIVNSSPSDSKFVFQVLQVGDEINFEL